MRWMSSIGAALGLRISSGRREPDEHRRDDRQNRGEQHHTGVHLEDEERPETVGELVSLLELERLDVRRDIVEGGIAAVRASRDPMIVAVRQVEELAADYARRAAALNATVAANSGLLGEAIYAAYGRALPPDATFTLRISDGVVQGYPANGTITPYRTSMYGLFARSAEFGDVPPFRLTGRWKAAEHRLDLATPMNFVSTNDIIGGNSGSPVLNGRGEQVGLVFDGNYEGLGNDYYYDPNMNRTISVDIRFVLFVTEKVGGAGWLLDEMKIVGK